MKRVIAREWLYLVLGFFVGLVIMPPLLYMFLSPDSYTATHTLGKAYLELFETLLGGDGFGSVLLAILIVLVPYLLYQFGRSIIWALRVVRNK